jgi:hypothetical protein
MTCVSFDDYKYFSLTFSENFDKRFFVVTINDFLFNNMILFASYYYL